MIKAFNKRFPFVKVEMLRAPGGQLITRVKTEAAAGKLSADVVDHSDRALMQPHRGPVPGLRAAERRRLPPGGAVSPKLWPRVTLVWAIAYKPSW